MEISQTNINDFLIDYTVAGRCLRIQMLTSIELEELFPAKV